MSAATTRRPGPRPRKPMPLDGAMITALASVGAVAVLLSLGGLWLRGWSAALGVAVGGLVATLNLWLFAYIARGVLRGGSSGRLWGVLGGVKFLALLGGAYILLDRGVTSGLTMAIGYVSLPVGVALGGFLAPRADEIAQDDPQAP